MPEVCGEPHPDQPEITCDKPRPCFLNHMGGGQVWLGEPDPREGTRHRGRTRKQTLAEMGGRVPRSTTAGAPIDALQPPRFVRSSDPETAREAYERYEPKQGTAKSRVLNYLRDREGHWVDAPELTTPEVGGFAGTRRLRELREDGWGIETRPKPGATNTWQHRLAPVAQQA